MLKGGNTFLDIALDHGIVTQDQLKKAADRQEKKGGSLEQNLIELGHFTEDSLVSIFVKVFGFPFIDLRTNYVDLDALKIVPSWVARKFSLIPVRVSKKYLAVAMADPLDKEAITALRKEIKHQKILLLVGKKSDIDFFVNKYYGSPESPRLSVYIPTETESKSIIKQYTFDNFVVGKSNEFAHSVSSAVAKEYSEETNPLFIYSDAGLGKTHLLVAIWNYIVEHQLPRKAVYCSSNDFISALRNSIKQEEVDEFVSRYESADILLIDDIGFLAGDEVAQQQLSHIFDHLFHNNKQIVVANDRPPSEHFTLMKQIRTRFESGVVARIDPPDLATRIAILKKKMKSKRISDEIINLIAEKVDTNVRELEGVLKEVLVFCNCKKRNITRSEAEEILLRRTTLRPYTA